MSKVETKVVDIIKAKAKADGHQVVFYKMHTAYSEDALDITDHVLTQLNKDLAKVEVNFKK